MNPIERLDLIKACVVTARQTLTAGYFEVRQELDCIEKHAAVLIAELSPPIPPDIDAGFDGSPHQRAGYPRPSEMRLADLQAAIEDAESGGA